MANNYKSNPIMIDTFGADLDIALLAFGISEFPLLITGVLFDGGTANDKILLKNAKLKEIIQLTTSTYMKSVSMTMDKFSCSGLKLVATDQTVTSGKLFIYI
jgi:hypothetical protein